MLITTYQLIFKQVLFYSFKTHEILVCIISYFLLLTYNDWITVWLLYVLFILGSFYLFLYISIHIYSWLLLCIYSLNLFSFFELLHTLYISENILYVGEFIVCRLSSVNYGMLSFFFNNINTSFFFLTLFIGFFANCFTYIYMRAELLVERFIFFLNMFIISMSILLLSSNWITLLLGWELIGTSSYLLINFWVFKISTFKAAFKAFIFNKLSDICLFTVLIIFSEITLDYSFNLIIVSKQFTLNYINSFYYFSQINILLVSLVICAFCKSAQLGFHIWLPDSMEAPIPASALIHSATLVSAGIFILLKFWVFIKYVYVIYFFIMFWGALTAFIGAIIAATQTDLKKILAYSTISHCGYLICTLFLENWIITVLYLYIHGIFKAFSFMAFGNLIYSFKNTQDLVRLSNVFFFKQTNFYFLVFSLLNLSSMPLTFGFFIKHLFLINYLSLNFSYVIYVLIFFTSLVGILYSIRILCNLFFSYFKQPFLLYSTEYISIKKIYIYNFLNIDWIISLILFFGMIFGLYVTLSIYYLLQLHFLSSLTSYYTIFTTFYSLKFYGLLFSYFYLIIMTFFLKNNFQEYLFNTYFRSNIYIFVSFWVGNIFI